MGQRATRDTIGNDPRMSLLDECNSCNYRFPHQTLITPIITTFYSPRYIFLAFSRFRHDIGPAPSENSLFRRDVRPGIAGKLAFPEGAPPAVPPRSNSSRTTTTTYRINVESNNVNELNQSQLAYNVLVHVFSDEILQFVFALHTGCTL
jgi:hypothetical protein